MTDTDRVDTAIPKCDYCGARVSEGVARVFADETGNLLTCPNCSANAGIAEASQTRLRRP